MTKQLFKEGDTFKQGKTELECVMVNFRERDGVKENFVYSFRSKAEIDEETKESTNEEESKGE